MKKLIDKEKLLERLYQKIELTYSAQVRQGLTIAQNIIREFPEDERPTGEWKVSDNRWGLGSLRCSNCNIYYDTDPNYCPNCGAKMKGVEE